MKPRYPFYSFILFLSFACQQCIAGHFQRVFQVPESAPVIVRAEVIREGDFEFQPDGSVCEDLISLRQSPFFSMKLQDYRSSQRIRLYASLSGMKPLTHNARVSAIAQVLNDILPGKTYFKRSMFIKSSAVFSRVVEGQGQIARAQISLSGNRQIITGMDVEVRPEFQKMGFYYFLLAQLLTEFPEVTLIEAALSKENVEVFERSLSPRVLRYILNHREPLLQRRDLPEIFRRSVDAALLAVPGIRVRRALQFSTIDYTLDLQPRPEGSSEPRSIYVISRLNPSL